MSPVSHGKWADSWRRCSWLFEWTLHHWDMIKNSSAWVQLYLSSCRCLRMIKHGTAFNTKRGYIPPWKSGVALCPGALPQPFDSCQGFITQKAAHSAAQYGRFLYVLCSSHVNVCGGQADVWAGNDCNAHRRVKYTLFSAVKSVCVYFSVVSAHQNTYPPYSLFPVCTQFVRRWGAGLLLQSAFFMLQLWSAPPLAPGPRSPPHPNLTPHKLLMDEHKRGLLWNKPLCSIMTRIELLKKSKKSEHGYTRNLQPMPRNPWIKAGA